MTRVYSGALLPGIALLPLFLSLVMPLYAGGRKDKEPVVRVTGTVRLVGSAEMPDLVISGPGMEWYIAREDAGKLMDLQHREVVVEGIETVRELRFANGSPAGERRTLSKVKLISVL